MGDLDLKLPTVLAEEMQEPQIRQFAANYLGEETAAKFLTRVLPEKAKRNYLSKWEKQQKEREDARSLLYLVRNPYLLAALIFIYTSSPNGDLPRNTGALMRMLARALWEREWQRGVPGWIPFEEMEEAFGRLAFAMIDEDMPIDVPIDYVLKKLSGLWGSLGLTTKKAIRLIQIGHKANFIDPSSNRVRFYHQLLQEYFAAVALERRSLQGVLSPPKINKIGERIATKWDNVVIALCGIVQNTEAIVAEVDAADPFLGVDCTVGDEQLSKKLLLLDTLDNADWRMRWAAIRLLEEVEDVAAVPHLLEALQDSEIFIRASASKALGRIGGREAIEGLLKALHDVDRNVRSSAAFNLGRIGDSMGVQGLLETLNDKDPDVRNNAVLSLGRIADPVAVPSLIEKLSDTARPLNLKVPRICNVTAEVLERIATPEALEAVVSWWIRELSNTEISWNPSKRFCDYAAEALTRIGTPEALEAVARWRAGQQ